jgi:NhaP-type Na+/H+ or K+/H+ antiporter
LALIVEYHAKGPLTTVTLGVTILKDVVVIILFSIAMVAAKLLTGVGGELDLALVGLILWEVLGSLAIGAGLGYLLGKYIDTVGRESPLILLALSFFAMELAHNFHLSGLLLCMATGFFVENYTTKGDALIQAIERYSLPVFVLFFTITGAQLDLAVLRKIWPLVLLLVAVRTFAIWAGTTAGSVFAKDPPVVRKNLWLGFITQAGVSLGLATLIERELPGIGGPLKTTIVAVVAVNQIIGPILFRWGLLTSKEGKTQSPTKP